VSGTFLRTGLECPAPHVCEVPQQPARWWKGQRFEAGAIWRCECGQVWCCDYTEPEPEPPRPSAFATDTQRATSGTTTVRATPYWD
jgi:hypothetical protein